MSLTRRALLTGLPLLLAVPRSSQAQETWIPSGHRLNHPNTCLGWWLTTPFTGTVTWRDLVHRGVGTLTSMALGSSATSGLQRRTSRIGGWGHVAFDGTGDVVVLPALLDNPATFSVSLWFRVTSLATKQALITKAADYDTSTAGWYLLLHQAAPTAAIGLWVVTNGSNYRGIIGSTPLTTGWHHVVAAMGAINDTAQWTVYVDGRRDVPDTSYSGGTVTSTANAVAMRVGMFGGGAYPLTGAADDVRLYVPALSAVQARLLYQDSRLSYPTLLAPGPQVAYAPAPPLPSVKLPSLFFSP